MLFQAKEQRTARAATPATQPRLTQPVASRDDRGMLDQLVRTFAARARYRECAHLYYGRRLHTEGSIGAAAR